MARVISIHEYTLKPGVDEASFERALHQAEARGLLRLPGLVEHHFIKGIRGSRRGYYAAVWIYSSLDAWEALWGAIDEPIGSEEYPENWRVWEDQVLAKYLESKPDRIVYTAYREI